MLRTSEAIVDEPTNIGTSPPPPPPKNNNNKTWRILLKCILGAATFFFYFLFVQFMQFPALGPLHTSEPFHYLVRPLTYLYGFWMSPLYMLKKESSIPRAATVRMFSMESTATLPAVSSAFLLLVAKPARAFSCSKPETINTGTMPRMIKVRIQE